MRSLTLPPGLKASSLAQHRRLRRARQVAQRARAASVPRSRGCSRSTGRLRARCSRDAPGRFGRDARLARPAGRVKASAGPRILFGLNGCEYGGRRRGRGGEHSARPAVATTSCLRSAHSTRSAHPALREPRESRDVPPPSPSARLDVRRGVEMSPSKGVRRTFEGHGRTASSPVRRPDSPVARGSHGSTAESRHDARDSTTDPSDTHERRAYSVRSNAGRSYQRPYDRRHDPARRRRVAGAQRDSRDSRSAGCAERVSERSEGRMPKRPRVSLRALAVHRGPHDTDAGTSTPERRRGANEAPALREAQAREFDATRRSGRAVRALHHVRVRLVELAVLDRVAGEIAVRDHRRASCRS